MFFTYSKDLVAQTIDIFQREDGILLTENEAMTVLDSFAGLYLAFGQEAEPAQAASAVETATLDLIDAHLMN